jgi:histone acetyltransferase 1
VSQFRAGHGVIDNDIIAAFEKQAIFQAAISDTSNSNWTPPGELWKTIQSGSKTFEVWKGSLADLAVQQMLKRIQILVSFFIEAGTPLDLRETEEALKRWTVFFLYQKTTETPAGTGSPYTFMGYSTVYRYFMYQPPTPPASPATIKKQPIQPARRDDFKFPAPEENAPELQFSSHPCRSRISQFVILPPFQKGGNGSRFYNAIFDNFLADAKTIEITVEDPNEAFDDLRDLNDLARLRLNPTFAALRLNTKVSLKAKGPVPRDIIDVEALEKIRTKFKIAPRQFARVVEMQLLSLIPLGVRQSLIEHSRKSIPNLSAKEHEYHLWILMVKKRLYKHNKDMLIQLDRTDRIQKLEEVTGGVEADYARLLRDFDKRIKGPAVALPIVSSNGKRSSPEEVEEVGEPSAKKVKFS